MDGLKRFAATAINVILWILIIVIAFFAIVTFSTRDSSKVSSVFGFTPLQVLTDSMSPTFKANDLIIIKKGDASKYEEGDIISFWTVIEGKRAINTHRIQTKIDTNGLIQFVTKGDANDVSDTTLVSTNEVIGRYAFMIPLMGALISALSNSWVFLIIIVLPLLGFFVYQMYKLIAILIELKKATVMEATQEAMGGSAAEELKKREAELAAREERLKRLEAEKPAQTSQPKETASPDEEPRQTSPRSDTERRVPPTSDSPRRVPPTSDVARRVPPRAPSAPRPPRSDGEDKQ